MNYFNNQDDDILLVLVLFFSVAFMGSTVLAAAVLGVL